MDPAVESALIAAVATLVGVGGTVIVAIAAARNARRTNQATIDAAHAEAQLTLDATREALFVDHYSRALEQLGSANLNVRIGGIYALEGIALNSRSHHPTVMEVLTAFIREDSRATADANESAQGPLPDVLAALVVVGRREVDHDIRRMDLTLAHLVGVTLRDANLAGADLRGANLTGATLRSANLAGAILWGTDLAGADLTGANLTGAALRSADLSGAKLVSAKLADADLDSAILSGAYLPNADLTGAILARADLVGADLFRAILDRTDLTDADLTGAVWPANVSVPADWKLDVGSLLTREQQTPDADAS